MSVRVQFRGAEELRSLAKDLRGQADRTLARNLRRELRRSCTPMRDAVKAGALAVPSKGPRHTGLRAAMARATRLQVLLSRNAAVRVLVDSSKMPAGQKALPLYVDGVRKRWRHPVFGNKGAWVNQGPHPFFWAAVRPHIKEARAGVLDAVERTASAIEKG